MKEKIISVKSSKCSSPPVFHPKTEEKVQKWIIKDKNQQAKAKASLDFWK